MKRFRIMVAGLLVMVVSLHAEAQTQVRWTEEEGRLGLGYPVPVPVDTPLPFDGFRTHAGLHLRHQSLMDESPVVDGEIVGQTLLNRDIWAYRLSTPSQVTPDGLPKAAIMYAGTVHAREWQSPEVVTGLMELMAEDHDDGHWLQFVADHVSIVVVPVINVDGFLMTQRYPDNNWLDSDPRHPAHWPRDGRMRRKNHRDADENLFTRQDHLHGVDLNRNNEPFWGVPPVTADPLDLVYRGPGPESEPETRALYEATRLAPGDRLRFYADMHSYTRVFFSVRTDNTRRNAIQSRLFRMISEHHADLPGDKIYTDVPGDINRGIGTTSEYFAHVYDIPSATWEIEPGHDAGAEYGGFGINSSDGFILPDREITRVRENSALSMAAAAYHMAGPPHLARASIQDRDTGAVLWQARWARARDDARELLEQAIVALEPGRDYQLWLAFSKPMRWREDGQVVPFPGQSESSLDLSLSMEFDGEALDVEFSEPVWLDEAGSGPDRYFRYRDDAVAVDFSIVDDARNRELIEQAATAGVGLAVDTVDLTGHRLDADPSTVVDWVDGAWKGYEGEHHDRGGVDRSLAVPVTTEAQSVSSVGPGHSAAWFDPARDGEGWMLEMLSDDLALGYWFTYDENGNPRWLIGTGEILANRIEFSHLELTSGGRFGPDFNPADVVREPAGHATLVFDGCDSAWIEYVGLGQQLDHELVRLSRIAGLDCPEPEGPMLAREQNSGSWYDPAHDGEGFVLQWLDHGEALLLWFTYDPEGNQHWMIGMGEEIGRQLQIETLQSTRGARFGHEFDPADVEFVDWGRLGMDLDCLAGQADYQSILPEFGQGEFELQRLSILAGLACAQ
jgi:hypothetical protein